MNLLRVFKIGLFLGFVFFLGLLSKPKIECATAVNIASVALINGLNREDHSKELSQIIEELQEPRLGCELATFLYVRALIGLGHYMKALDAWDATSLSKKRPVVVFQSSFTDAWKARQFKKQGKWDEAVEHYRQMFASAPSNLNDSVTFEYHESLGQAYQQHPKPYYLFLAVQHALKTGELNTANQLLNKISTTHDSDSLSSQVEAYRHLVRGDLLVQEKRFRDATNEYLQIRSQQRHAYLSSLIRLLEISNSGYTNGGVEEARNLLNEWQPMLSVHAPLAQGMLTGVEILDPETIPDGGLLSLLLFWNFNVAPPDLGLFSGRWIQLNGNRWVQYLTTRNLVLDPGFEWFTPTSQNIVSEISNWFYPSLYGEPSTTVNLHLMERANLQTRVACLANSTTVLQSGIAGHNIQVQSREAFLQITWLHSEGSTNGVAGLLWTGGDMEDPVYRHDYIATGVSSQWEQYVGVQVAPGRANRTSPWLLNYQSKGRVCFDDVILIRLMKN